MDFWESLYREFEIGRCNARLNTYTAPYKNHNAKKPAHGFFAINAQGI